MPFHAGWVCIGESLLSTALVETKENVNCRVRRKRAMRMNGVKHVLFAPFAKSVET